MPDLLLAHLFALFRLMRLKFLLYSPLLYTVGILLLPTLYDSHVNLWQYFQGLFFVWVVHINTHFVNEYFDYEADVKNILSSPWTGGSKVLVAGLLRPETSLVAALITTAIAIAQALAFRNVEVRFLAYAILFLSWAYTLPPLKMSHRGMGELDVMLVINFFCPLFAMTIQVQARTFISPSSNENFLALSNIYTRFLSSTFVLVPLGLIGFARMMVMNMADEDPDRATNKQTLVVLIGRSRSIVLFFQIQLLAVAILLYHIVWNKPSHWPVAVLLLGVSFVFRRLFLNLYQVYRSDRWIYDLPLQASLHNAFSAVAVIVALLYTHEADLTKFSLAIGVISAWLAGRKFPQLLDAIPAEEAHHGWYSSGASRHEKSTRRAHPSPSPRPKEQLTIRSISS